MNYGLIAVVLRRKGHFEGIVNSLARVTNDT